MCKLKKGYTLPKGDKMKLKSIMAELSREHDGYNNGHLAYTVCGLKRADIEAFCRALYSEKDISANALKITDTDNVNVFCTDFDTHEKYIDFDFCRKLSNIVKDAVLYVRNEWSEVGFLNAFKNGEHILAPCTAKVVTNEVNIDCSRELSETLYEMEVEVKGNVTGYTFTMGGGAIPEGDRRVLLSLAGEY